ncbi:MAG: acetylglutamate kinase [Ruminococcaceae bacterium]|nr:acetylglutamate kinase [Oscillospiraceae bacterium]
MNMTPENRAQALVEALPYIQKFYGKTIVIKYGGNAMIEEDIIDAAISDVVLLSLVGIRVVLVHGGGPEIAKMLEKTGKESKFINGLRYTDKETMDVVQMVLCGKINKNIVSMINKTGGRAVGVSGLDDNLLCATKLLSPDGEDLGFVGDVQKVNPAILENSLKKGLIPVVSTVASGIDDNNTYNINADTAAAKIAIALGAEKLILMTNTRGVLMDQNNEDTLIPVIKLSEIADLKQSGIIAGGMMPKIDCCVDAVENGVKRTHILDGRIPHAILIEILSHAGIGTMIL